MTEIDGPLVHPVCDHCGWPQVPVTYTDGTLVQDGDRIRYHQAPGGVLPADPWVEGAAVLVLDWPKVGCREIMLRSDVLSFGEAVHYRIRGHVIERL